jgi:probable HAF family extracellular repeat protein
MIQQLAMVMVVVSVAVGNAWGGVAYTLTDLGMFPGGNGYTVAYGLNASGQVVGYCATGSGAGTDRAFLYSNGMMTDLGTLGGSWGQGCGINASGQVVGVSTTSDGSYRAFLYSNGTMTNLGTLGTDPVSSRAYSINASGQVVGDASFLPDLTAHYAFLYSNGKMVQLCAGEALSINDSGQVVGYATSSNGTDHAFLYSNGTMTDLGTLGGSGSQANGINASGQVVGGSATSSGSYHSFLYSKGTMTDLNTLGGTFSMAVAINSSGQAVGTSTTSGGFYRAFLYSNGTMTDLNNLIDPAFHVRLTDACSINDKGQIVGYGMNRNGNIDAYLLTPTLTPEPSTLVLLGIATVSLLGCARRRRK